RAIAAAVKPVTPEPIAASTPQGNPTDLLAGGGRLFSGQINPSKGKFNMSTGSKCLAAVVIAVALIPALAHADDWTGQPSTSPVQGPAGPGSFGNGTVAIPAPQVCVPGGGAPPCAPGQHIVYDIGSSGATQVPGIPAAAAAAGSNLGINAAGFYLD